MVISENSQANRAAVAAVPAGRLCRARNKPGSVTLEPCGVEARGGMATMDGRITLAQESRFQLTDEAGVSHLFTLGPWCAAEPEHLVALAARQAPVRVTYKAGHDVISAIARRIDLRGEAAQ